MTVGFNGVASLIDEVGGVEIDVQPDEIEHLNNYQSTMAQELGRQYVPVQNTGLQTLNGLQATAYCRIRYTDGGDFKRTQRQKEVLSKAFAKLKAAGPVTMLKVANQGCQRYDGQDAHFSQYGRNCFDGDEGFQIQYYRDNRHAV